jgi:hypothetical protein
MNVVCLCIFKIISAIDAIAFEMPPAFAGGYDILNACYDVAFVAHVYFDVLVWLKPMVFFIFIGNGLKPHSY